MKTFIVMIMGLVLLTGCNTVAPKATNATQGSFDIVPDATGNHQTSGAMGFYQHQLVITRSAWLRYETLVMVYGKRFTPPILFGEVPVMAPASVNKACGTTGLILMNEVQLDHFATMTEWRRNNQ